MRSSEPFGPLRERKFSMDRSKFFYLLITAFILRSGDPSWAQGLICCNQLVNMDGDWVGANRECAGYLEDHPEKRDPVCDDLLKTNSVCDELKPYCKLCSGKDGDDYYFPDDPIVQSIIKGFHAQGIMIGPEHILVQSHPSGEVDQFVVRLDANGCVLPDGQCVMEAGENGYLPEGKQKGAFRHLYGSIVTIGDKTRVLTRIVNIETGEIMSTGKGDAGSGEQGATEATSNALDNMKMTCKEVKGLVLE